MLAAARARFAGDSRVTIVEQNLDEPLPDLGGFDAIVSSFAIHHCDDDRSGKLYAEIFSRLERAGVFWNLEHVAPPSAGAHEQCLRALGMTAADEDPSNKLAPVDTQLAWLREVGFVDVDCYWKWLELALMGACDPCDRLRVRLENGRFVELACQAVHARCSSARRPGPGRVRMGRTGYTSPRRGHPPASPILQ